MLVSRMGHADVAELLIKKGRADPNVRALDGSSAIIFASQGSHLGIVKTLIEAHADVNLQRADGTTALMYAAFGQLNCIISDR